MATSAIRLETPLFQGRGYGGRILQLLEVETGQRQAPGNRPNALETLCNATSGAINARTGERLKPPFGRFVTAERKKVL